VRFGLYYLTSMLAIFPAAARAQGSAQRDWVTWGYDQERTSWNRGETALSKDNVSRLELKWGTQLSTRPTEVVLSTLTSPLVVENVNTAEGPKTLVIVVGADDTIFTLDADTGKVLWQKTFPNTLKPVSPANWLCSNTQNATPVIDKQKSIVYFNTSDGKLRGLSLNNGEERLVPTDFVTPFARNWSLNLIDNVIYTGYGRGCGGATGTIAAMDVKDPAHPVLTNFYLSGGRPGGPWGRAGVVRGPKGIYAQTADGAADPGSGSYGESVLALALKSLRLIDSFTPANWQYLNAKDLDMGAASPVVFPFQNRTLVASAAKEGVVYLLDAGALGGGVNPDDRMGVADHSTPLYKSARLGNDEVLLGGRGVWGALATYEDPQGQRFLYVPMWGPPSKEAPQFKYSYGDTPNGSLMAFQVSQEGGKPALIPTWMSRDMHVPDPPVVANGVVYAIQTGENTVQNNRPGGDAAGGGGGGRRGPGAPGGPPGAGPGTDGRGVGAPSGASGGPGAGRGGAGAGSFLLQAAKFRATPVTNLVLYAYDAETGKQLYSSEKIISNWVHFSEPVVADGKVFIVSWDAHIYAFGLKR
jgi:outer membrane protein assembly factor BamB